jgi:hypothetical protein
LVRQTHEAAFPVIPVLMPGCENPPTGFLQLLTWIDLSKAVSILQQPDSLALLRAAFRGEVIAAPTIRAQVCPYKGLEPFREEDAPFFCGRDDAIHELVAKVQAQVFVAIVGASGSGKSSLVFAGLLPALRKSRTRTWDVVSFRPGKSPLVALANAFGNAPENAGPAEVDAYLERRPNIIAPATHKHSRVLLIAVSTPRRKSRIDCSSTWISGKNSTPWRPPLRTRSTSGNIQATSTNSLSCWLPLHPARGRGQRRAGWQFGVVAGVPFAESGLLVRHFVKTRIDVILHGVTLRCSRTTSLKSAPARRRRCQPRSRKTLLEYPQLFCGRPSTAATRVNNFKPTDMASVSKVIHTDNQLHAGQFGKTA